MSEATNETHRPGSVDRKTVTALIHRVLAEITQDRGEELPEHVDDDTILIGSGAVVTSLGLVLTVVELEQTLEEEYGIVLSLADEKAVSRKHSPFRTIGTLADYVCSLIDDASAGNQLES